MFWTLAALLTAMVTATIVWPLLRLRPIGVPAREAHDVEVYAAQLGELDADLKRGIIGPADADVARAEIGRRLLRVAGGAAAPGQAAGRGTRGALVAGLAVAVALPLASLAVYAGVGSPGRPDSPLAARPSEAPAETEISEMVAAAEARLATNPEDGRGWDVLAPVYLRLGDTEKAVTAFRSAIDLLGETPERSLGLGEALTRGAGGEVTDEAREIFESVAAADPALIAPRIFLALDLSQERRFPEAVEAWSAILDASPADGPYRPMAEAALADARAQGAPGGPAPAEIAAAAAAIPAGGEDEMIAGMVANLAARLETAPQDAEGWARLIQAYGVLGDEAAGQAAVERARQAFPESSAEWPRIAASAEAAGFALPPEARP